jgi:hypothetical protein
MHVGAIGIWYPGACIYESFKNNHSSFAGYLVGAGFCRQESQGRDGIGEKMGCPFFANVQ